MTSLKKLAIASIVVFGLSVPALAQAQSLKGVWRVVEVTGTDGKVNPKPEPGLYIFTDRHYSIMRVTEPRPVLPEKPADKDLAATFGPFTANSGTYQVKGSQLMTQPSVAKNPTVMTGKGQTSELKMEGASTAYVIGGGQAGKTIVKLQRVE